jgi:hypothetical protein
MPHIMDPNRPADGRAEQEISARLFPARSAPAFRSSVAFRF